jgi:hypothetical protein
MPRYDRRFAWRAWLLLAALCFLRVPAAPAQESNPVDPPGAANTPAQSADPSRFRRFSHTRKAIDDTAPARRVLSKFQLHVAGTAKANLV